jgi:DNA/RNA endonuclease G (NUC1)
MTSTRYKKSAKRKRSSAFRNIFSTAVTIAIAYAGYNAVACGNSSNTSSNNNAVTNQNVEQHQQIDLFKVVTSKDLPQEMLTYKGMKISYNPQLHIPNYVVWELTRDEVHGTVSRKGKKFQADPNFLTSSLRHPKRQNSQTRTEATAVRGSTSWFSS